MGLAFDEKPIGDFFNYFNSMLIEEKGDEESQELVPMKGVEEFRKELSKFKMKGRKIEKNSLKTSCSCCFSNHSEPYNRIKRCPECGLRMHVLCHSIRKKCPVCTY